MAQKVKYRNEITAIMLQRTVQFFSPDSTDTHSSTLLMYVLIYLNVSLWGLATLSLLMVHLLFSAILSTYIFAFEVCDQWHSVHCNSAFEMIYKVVEV